MPDYITRTKGVFRFIRFGYKYQDLTALLKFQFGIYKILNPYICALLRKRAEQFSMLLVP